MVLVEVELSLMRSELLVLLIPIQTQPFSGNKKLWTYGTICIHRPAVALVKVHNPAGVCALQGEVLRHGIRVL